MKQYRLRGYGQEKVRTPIRSTKRFALAKLFAEMKQFYSYVL